MANAVKSAAMSKSPSSSTIAADFPPSSRKTRLARLAGGGHDRPAGRGGAGEGDHVDVGARRQGDTDFGVGTGEHVDHTGRDVGVVGDQLAERKRDQRRIRCALQHHGAPGRQRGRELGQRELRRVVVRDDRRHHPGSLFLHPAVVLHAVALAVAEILGQRVGLQQIRVVAHDRDRRVELGARAHRRRRTDLGDGQLGELVAMVDQRLVQLLEAADPQARCWSTSRWCRTRAARRRPRPRRRPRASGAWPTTSPVAGLIEGNVRGVSTNRPSISMRRSACGSDVSVAASPPRSSTLPSSSSLRQSFNVMETSFSSSANHTFAR